MFFPTNGPLPGSKLHRIISDVLQVTEDIGFKVRHMVCDQGASNQKAISICRISKP
jgi:sporulation-control protein spo0M